MKSLIDRLRARPHAVTPVTPKKSPVLPQKNGASPLGNAPGNTGNTGNTEKNDSGELERQFPAYEIDQLLDLAMKWADYTGDGEEARRRWREDVEATPQALRAGLAKYLQEQIRAARANGYSTRRPVPAMCRSFG